MTQNEIQLNALKSWLKNNKKGTFALATGTGKTIAALHCLHTMPKRDGKIHLFLAEVTDRKTDLYKDILKFDKLFGTNTLSDYNLKFFTYQSAYKLKIDTPVGLMICDEIHNSLTTEYFKVYSNITYDAIVGLSATIESKQTYIIEGEIYTKKELLNKVAPVIYTYNINDSIQEGVGREINVYVYFHELDNNKKIIKAGSKIKTFYQTEQESYNYWDKQFKQSLFILDEELKQLKLRVSSNKRASLLFSLPSKISVIQSILPHLKGKTILFGNDIGMLLQLTPNVVSSKNTDEVNLKIRNDFDNNKIKLIGSFKKLKQGANLKNLDNCFIISYYSSEGDLIQKVGRLRKNENKAGNVIIIVTKNTQEEVWFNKMIENITSFNIMYFNDISKLIEKYEFNTHN